jgi:hypothetical protein
MMMILYESFVSFTLAQSLAHYRPFSVILLAIIILMHTKHEIHDYIISQLTPSSWTPNTFHSILHIQPLAYDTPSKWQLQKY